MIIKLGVSQMITSSNFTLVSLQLPKEESVSLRASISFLLRSKGVSPRLWQMALHLCEWKNRAIPWVPRLPSPYSEPPAVWICGSV